MNDYSSQFTSLWPSVSFPLGNVFVGLQTVIGQVGLVLIITGLFGT
jgi:hypothetical protein